jgi:hypothetical protein
VFIPCALIKQSNPEEIKITWLEDGTVVCCKAGVGAVEAADQLLGGMQALLFPELQT